MDSIHEKMPTILVTLTLSIQGVGVIPQKKTDLFQAVLFRGWYGGLRNITLYNWLAITAIPIWWNFPQFVLRECFKRFSASSFSWFHFFHDWEWEPNGQLVICKTVLKNSNSALILPTYSFDLELNRSDSAVWMTLRSQNCRRCEPPPPPL